MQDNLLNRKNNNNLNYIYTGLQIISPIAFLNLDMEIFSINKIWNDLIKSNELYGKESQIEFLHVSTIDVYKDLLKKNLNFE